MQQVVLKLSICPGFVEQSTGLDTGDSALSDMCDLGQVAPCSGPQQLHLYRREKAGLLPRALLSWIINSSFSFIGVYVLKL